MDSDEFAGNQLSHDDDLFLEKVMIDIRLYVDILNKSCDRKVLLFPPVNNFRRFLIHQLVDNTFREANLGTLSIGQLYARRTVVYSAHPCIITEKNNIESANRNSSAAFHPESKILRDLKTHTMSTATDTKMKKSRKPDIQIYVPRGRRMLQTWQSNHTDTNQYNRSSEELTRTELPYYSDRDREKVESPEIENWDIEYRDDGVDTFVRANELFAETEMNNFNKVWDDEDNPVIDLITPENSNNESEKSRINTHRTSDKSFPDIETDNCNRACDKKNYLVTESAVTENWNVENGENVHSNRKQPICKKKDDTLVGSCVERFCDSMNNSHISIMNNVTKLRSNAKTPNEWNQKNDQSALCQDLASPSETVEVRTSSQSDAAFQKSEKEENDSISSVKPSVRATSSTPTSNNPKTNSVRMKPSECDWEELFNDEGDFVDDSLVEELMKTMGRVSIQRARQDYSPYQTSEERSSDGECIIEVYDFSADFKTDDLLTVFTPYRTDPGFQIVWVDDTHALAIFSTPMLADEVLNQDLPFVKTRPLKNATPKSRMRARNHVPAPVTRPKTCVSLARRLVSGHLGMKINVTDKQREAEKKLLSDAREKRRQIAKQKHDVWESTSSGGR